MMMNDFNYLLRNYMTYPINILELVFLQDLDCSLKAQWGRHSGEPRLRINIFVLIQSMKMIFNTDKY